MQYQNDDMDELFRRAADGYPLKMQEDNWDAVAGKLSVPAATAVGVNQQKSKKNNYKPATLLLLLLFISGTTALLVLNKQNDIVDNRTSFKNRENVKASIVNKDYPDNNYRKITIAKSKRVSSFSIIGEERNALKIKKQILFRAGFMKMSSNNPEISYTDELAENKNETSVNQNKPDEKNAGTGDINNQNSLANLLKEKQENNIVKDNETEKKNDSANAVKEKKKKEKKFYVGVFAGPQFNQVKSQGFSNAGVSAGLVVGVNLSKKLAVETGLFISEKKYFSRGEYFKMIKDASMPASMKVISLNGKSTVLEIPVTIKYNFIKKNRSNFFGTIGASSYILTNETNNYLAVVNGNKEQLAINYAKNANYFTAALNVSAGYEYKLKQTTLRVEPYVQSPLRNIGVGSMPVMSTGIHVGITLPFH